MSTQRKALIVAALMASVAVGWAVTRAAGERELTELFGGERAMQTLRQSETVRAWLVQTPNDYSKSLGDFDMRGEPVTVSEEQTAALVKTLLNRDSYLWDTAKGCAPVYGVRVEFATDGETVDVLFCFLCDILTVYDNGQAVGGEDFDNVRPELLKVIKPLFPDEKSIQSLKERG